MSYRSYAHSTVGVVALVVSIAACTDATTAPTVPRAPLPSHSVEAALIVSNLNDAGSGSLRQAIEDAAPGSTIDFDPALAGGTIALLSQLDIGDKELTIVAPQEKGITLHGGHTTRVIQVISAAGQPTVTLRNFVVTGGRAAPGAGILVIGRIRLENSTIAGNHGAGNFFSTSGDGGGIGLMGGVVTLVNSTVSANRSDYGGGGIGFVVDPSGHAGGTVSLVNSTIAFNEAFVGGGLLIRSDPLGTPISIVGVESSIISDNTSLTPETEDCAIVSAGVLNTSATGPSLTSTPSCLPIGAGMFLGIMHLGPLADNGGPTPTHALGIGSTAIDLADCSVNVDQRYVGRPLGHRCDVGAFEFDDHTKITITVDRGGLVNSSTGVAVVSGTVACTRTTFFSLAVTGSQQQKVRKINTTVQATGTVSVSCGPSPTVWAVALDPRPAAFVNSTMSVTAATVQPLPSHILPASTTVEARLAWSRK